MATKLTQTGKEVQEILNDASRLISITYSELVELRRGKALSPGSLYRIADYITTTTQENTQSAGHPFDVIVLALTNDTLAGRAWACHSERDEDTYFASSDLEAWQIWYSLDNDAERFAWADTANGKGVIYRMIDEWNNDCPYDFKNIQFKHPNDTALYPAFYYTFSTVISGVVGDHSFNGAYCNKNEIGVYATNQKQYLNRIVFINTSKASICYDNSFGNSCGNNSFDNDCFANSFGNGCSSNSFGNSCYFNSFGNDCDNNSFGNSCGNNSFGNGYRYNSFGNDCSSNSFGNSCSSNSFGNDCDDNNFGNGYRYNSFGDGCSSNNFGNSCSSNSFGDDCSSNSFGNNCSNNSFGNSCRNNSFGNSCGNNSFGNNISNNSFSNDINNNSFGNYCYSNSFGNNCDNNSFRNNCSNNSFGNDCSSNSFGNNCGNNSFGNYCYSNSFGNYCRYNKADDRVTSVELYNNQTASSNQQIQNYHFTRGLREKTIEVKRNRAYETTVAIDSSGNVKQFCIADIIQ